RKGHNNKLTHHHRPFFYVQPPSQPYYLYQHWQMNNPYSHYGLPGGFNFGRPCLHPYQYMQYPGFVFPHAPIYPVDYRRMFEPRFPSPHWNDMPRQQHPSQPPGQRETACSEVQTDPSDAITKLIECLDKMQASDLQGVDRELDSGVASQSSGMFSPGEEKKGEEQAAALILPSAPDDSCLEPSAVTFRASTTAVYDGDSSHRSLDVLSPPECWSGEMEEMEEELPLDSSSVHEEGPNVEQSAADEHLLPLEKGEVANIQSDIVVTDQSSHKCDADELLKRRIDPTLPSVTLPSSPVTESGDKVSKPEHREASSHNIKPDPSYQILKLPFESVLAPGAAGMNRLSSSSPYYYNYLSMPTTHERMSVLSPSLDELSSKDEMFSTDLEDMDLFPKHVYAGRRLTEVVDEPPPAAEEREEDWAIGSRRFMCACCGKSLPKGTGRSKIQSSKVYVDEGGDSEEEGGYGRGCEQAIKVVVRKHNAPRKTHSFPLRHAAKPWHKRSQHKDSADQVEQEKAILEIHTECVDMLTDRLCRDEVIAADQGRWGDGGPIPRRRPSPLKRQGVQSFSKMCSLNLNT
uniref:Bucky ball n=1 Tax=Sphaeramia orbicularis TaxID=375764 RepID=A0A673CWS4_9TELE